MNDDYFGDLDGIENTSNMSDSITNLQIYRTLFVQLIVVCDNFN